LVVGSGLEARLALQRLSKLTPTGTIYHLPTVVPADESFEFASQQSLTSTQKAPKKARLADVWGKTVISLKLPPMVLSQACDFSVPDGVKSLTPGLKVSRTSKSEESVLVSFSDGSDLLCQGVLFGDGFYSQGKLFWDKPSKPKSDPHAVRAWSFVTDDLTDRKVWEFRWAPAKSVELVPLPESRVLVRLRFKSPYGGELSVAELRELFSEFGSDMTAIFENVELNSVCAREERRISNPVFSPAVGCLALGRAAWQHIPMQTLGWVSRFVDRQLDVMVDQLRSESLNVQSFEAQCIEQLADLCLAEEFVRRHLHSDNALLRPLRNMILSLLPNSLVAGQLRGRLYLA
jgi:hypothetical protein